MTWVDIEAAELLIFVRVVVIAYHPLESLGRSS